MQPLHRSGGHGSLGIQLQRQGQTEGVALIGKLQQGGACGKDLLDRARALIREFAVVSENTSDADLLLEKATRSLTDLENAVTKSCFACMRAYSPRQRPQLKYPPLKSTCFTENATEGPKEPSKVAFTRKEEDERVPASSFTFSSGLEVQLGGFIRAHVADVLFEEAEEHPSIATKILDTLIQVGWASSRLSRTDLLSSAKLTFVRS